MAIQFISSLFIHLILPLFFLGWLAFAKVPYASLKLAVSALFGMYLLVLARAGSWHVFGSYWNAVFGVCYLIALIVVLVNLDKTQFLPSHGFSGWFNLAVVVAVLVVTLFWRIPNIYGSRTYPHPPVVLEFPLRKGNYSVVQGGSSVELNHHFSNRAQKYALDIVMTGAFGLRADALLPSSLEQYHIYDQAVYAPCTGKVLGVENTLQDWTPPEKEPDNPVGNYVIVLCQGNSILLSHFRQGSITVSSGQQIKAGDLLGHVGNSGNSSEPHLHIHAVKGVVSSLDAMIQTSEGLPILFDSRFLIRNDRISIS